MTETPTLPPDISKSTPCCNGAAMNSPVSPSIFLTPCECTDPGWCARHKCHKDRAQFEYCRRLIAWFERWERGEGPYAEGPPPPLDPCRQRGAEPINYVTCDLCGGQNLIVPVYACNLFGECTERRFGTRTAQAREMAHCLGCNHYEPVTAPSPEDHPIDGNGQSECIETIISHPPMSQP